MAIQLAQSARSQHSIAQDSTLLRQIFAAIEPESCPRQFNFHMHTTCSDGKLKPESLMEQAMSIGLKGLAITDHHTTNGYQAATQWLSAWQEQAESPVPMLWTGVEINANLLDVEVHILGYAFDPDHPRLQPYLQRRTAIGRDYEAVNVIEAIHRAGGLAVLAHPARYHRPAHELIPAASELGIDGVETYYAYKNPNPWRTSPEYTPQIQTLAKAYRLLSTCGTDTHGLSLLQRL